MSSPLILDDFSATLKDRVLFDIKSFSLKPGSSTVIIGKTGVGKSVLLRSTAGLIPESVFSLKGSMKVLGLDAYTNGNKGTYREWTEIRGKGMIFVPAESAHAMNPALSLDQNLRLLAPDAKETVERRLKEYFNIDFTKYGKNYPDEVSGGELQRITLMILLSRTGNFVLLDEPTVNLDRNLRGRFVEFLNKEILSDKDKTVLMASHDLDFVRALSMDHIVELRGSVLNPLKKLPENAGYERKDSLKNVEKGLELREVSQRYRVRGVFGEHDFSAFKDLNVDFKKSRIYGITGPSGCGKSSMIRAILRLINGTSGSIDLEGENLIELKKKETGNDPSSFKKFRKKMTLVQQDSRYAFFPDLKIKDSFSKINGSGKEVDWKELESYMNMINLPLNLLDTLPNSLSSGEMKRMDIVRALVSKPEVLLLDEPFAYIDFKTRGIVMSAISDYIAKNQTIVIVVTHEDFDLKYFIEEDYDFLTIGVSAHKNDLR